MTEELLQFYATYPRRLHVEIDTSLDLGVHGAAAAEWLDRGWRELLTPAAVRWAEAYAPNEVLTQIGRLEYWDGRRTRGKGSTAEAYRRAIDDIARGSAYAAGFTLRLEGPGGPMRPDATIATLHFERTSRDDEGAASQLWLALGRQACGAGALPADIQQAWTQLLLDGGRSLRADQGWLTLDTSGCAYETFTNTWRDGLRQTATRLRNYAWGMLLSGTHLETLGGLEHASAAAPVAEVRDLSSAAWPLAFFQLSDSLDDVSVDQLRALRDYLRPLLSPNRHGRYIGPPLRLAEWHEEGGLEALRRPPREGTRRPRPINAPPSRLPSMPHRPSGSSAGAVPIEWRPPIDPESLDCTVELAGPLSERERTQLETMVVDWYEGGANGAFGGPLHFLSSVVYVDQDPPPRIEWWIDAGSADLERALADLAGRLASHGSVVRLIVGP